MDHQLGHASRPVSWLLSPVSETDFRGHGRVTLLETMSGRVPRKHTGTPYDALAAKQASTIGMVSITDRILLTTAGIPIVHASSTIRE